MRQMNIKIITEIKEDEGYNLDDLEELAEDMLEYVRNGRKMYRRKY